MKINPEFKAQIPALSAEEYKQLEINIVTDGCRDPLVVWNDTIIDGHNRFEICQAHGIEYKTVSKEFKSESEAKIWMLDLAFGQRNLPDWAKYENRQFKKDELLKVGKESQGSRTDILSIADKKLEKPHDTRGEIAKDLGWSTGKVAMADKVNKEATPEVIEQIRSGEKTINSVYQEIKTGKAHVSNNSGNNHWYTPEKYTESARKVMGNIDLDPASSEIANKSVKADAIFTEEDDGLTKKWTGRVWMNPPYSQPLIKHFSEKLCNEFESDNISEAIVLVNNATETTWFQSMAKYSSAICFPDKRIKFIDVDGNEGDSPLQGQAIIYMGDNPDEFGLEFMKYGLVFMR